MNIRTLFALAGFALAGSAIGSGAGPVPEDAQRECVKECRSSATFSGSGSEPIAGDGERSVSVHETAHGAPAVRCVQCHGGGWLDWKPLGTQDGRAEN